jgi:hypothetical protein
MGHHELGRLSGSRKWRQVIALISGGADEQSHLPVRLEIIFEGRFKLV